MAEPANGLSINTTYYRSKQPYDVCTINGSKFALFFKAIKYNENLNIDLSDYHVVFLAPIEVEKNITVKAISVIVLTTLLAKTGQTVIDASGKFIMIGGEIISKMDNKIDGKKGCYTCGINKELRDAILGEFREGISKMHGPKIVDALIYSADVVQDPLGEKEIIEIAKGLEFFDIPLKI